MLGRRVGQAAALFAVCAGVTCALFLNFCNWVYRCGCTSLWAGADAHCNIHNLAGRHCPFCAHGTQAYALVLSSILIPQFVLSWWPPSWDWRLRLILGLLMFPVFGLIAAAAYGWLDGYWA